MSYLVLSESRIQEINKLVIPHRHNFGYQRKTFHKSKNDIYVHTLKSDDSEIIFSKILEELSLNGWEVKLDPWIDEQFKCLNKTHKYAVKGLLHMTLEYFPAGMKLDIFPEYNIENECGPRYGFNKYESMTYLDKKRCDNILNTLSGALIRNEYEIITKPKLKNAREEIEFRIRECWHFKEYDTNFGQSNGSDSYNSKDGEGNILKNGLVRYFYGHDKKIKRGTVFHHINNMWWVITDKDNFHNVASFDFYSSLGTLKSNSDRKEKLGLVKKLIKVVGDGNQYKSNLIRKLLWKANGNSEDEQRYLVQCREHEDGAVLWWKWNSCGYTEYIELAGYYSLKKAQDICKNPQEEIMFKLEEYHLATTKPKKQKRIKKKKYED